MSCVVVRVCSEQNVLRKNAKIFVCILQTVSQKFMKRKCKTKQNFAKKNREKNYFSRNPSCCVRDKILFTFFVCLRFKFKFSNNVRDYIFYDLNIYSREALYFIFA